VELQLTPDSPDATVVTEIFDCSGASAYVREAVSDGKDWIEAMTTTLQRLDALCGSGRVVGLEGSAGS
jgi:hypothetical protein